MSFMSLDNVNVTEESFGRSEIQLDWYNFSCCLSFLFLKGLQLLLIFGPVGWMLWLLFGASLEFLESSEGSTSNTEDEEDETVDKKLKSIENLLGHVVKCKRGRTCRKEDCQDFKIDLYEQFYDSDYVHGSDNDDKNDDDSGSNCSFSLVDHDDLTD